MSVRKTLGGDRVGSGNKMKIDMHGYERSTHDMGYVWRSSMSVGTLVPFLCEVALPGDTFDINLGCDIKTLPTVGPLFGSAKVQLDVYQAPIRLYNALLHNNMLGIGMQMNGVKFPVHKFTPTDVTGTEDLDNSQINPSSVMAYLGLRGIGQKANVGETPDREFNAIPYLALAEIYKNYYANKQEGIGAVIHSPMTAVVENVEAIGYEDPQEGYVAFKKFPQSEYRQVQAGFYGDISWLNNTKRGFEDIYFETSLGTMAFNDLFNVIQEGGSFTRFQLKSELGIIAIMYWRYRQAGDTLAVEPKVVTFDLDNIDVMRERVLSFHSKVTAFDVRAQDLEPYKWLYEQPLGVPNLLSTQEGLFVKTYQSDMFNNWLDKEYIDGPNGVNAVSAIDVSDGTLTVDAIMLARKVYDMLLRVAVSGGTYDDWLDVQYDHDRYVRAESPMYMGGLSKELIFQEVVSNSATDAQALGTLGGRGRLSDKHKGGELYIKVDEPSYIIGLISITPRIDYSQGNKWDLHLKTMDDLHKPALDQIGFQELLVEQMAWWDTTYNNVGIPGWVRRSAGKQPAWLNYMTNVNVVRGNFAVASKEMFMTFNRRYEALEGGVIKDLTTYIDPVKFNFIFAESSLDAQNYWAQIGVDMIVRRKMSAKVMPNL